MRMTIITHRFRMNTMGTMMITALIVRRDLIIITITASAVRGAR